jgi:hypothetical protein
MNIYLPALTYGGIEAGYMHARDALVEHLRAKGITLTRGVPVAGESLITRGRNRAAHAFLARKECTHLLFIDCDIVFQPTDVMRLLDSGRSFVGAPYPAKTFPPALIGVPFVEDGKVKVSNDGFVRARDVGTGFLLLHRSVFETLEPKVVKYKDDLIGGKGETMGAYFDCGPEDAERDDSQYLSEDWWFSRLYQACGGECWLDTRAKLGHIGKHVFSSPSLAEQWAERVGDPDVQALRERRSKWRIPGGPAPVGYVREQLAERGDKPFGREEDEAVDATMECLMLDAAAKMTSGAA